MNTRRILLSLLVLGGASLVVIFSQNNKTPSKKEASVAQVQEPCIKEEPYPMDPLIKASLAKVNNYLNWEKSPIQDFNNCLNIHFSPEEGIVSSGKEGFILNLGSDLNNLEIVVSDKYKTADPVVIGAVLSRELTYVIAYVNREWGKLHPEVLQNVNLPDCYEEEATALHNLVVYFGSMTNEDLKIMVEQTGELALGNEPHEEITTQIQLAAFVRENEEELSNTKDPVGFIREYFVKVNPIFQGQCGDN